MSAKVGLRRRTPAPVSDSLARLGERIRRARGEAGLSQAQLGQPHFTRAYVSALELGKIRPAMKSLEFLAAKLGKPTAYFLEDEQEERKRRERELAVVRATQLVAEGSGEAAVQLLAELPMEDLSPGERLDIKKVLGRAYLESGDPTKASAALTDALAGYQRMQDAENAARVRGLLGGALIPLMRYAEAEEYLEGALRATVNGTVRDPLFRVHVLHNLGVALYQRASYQKALEHLELAADEGADIGDPKWLASLYAAMGMSRRQMGDYEGAVTCLRKSEALFEATHNTTRVAEIRFQAARALRALGNKTRALEMIDQAAMAAEAGGNLPLSVSIAAYRGLALAEDGNTAAALAILEPLVARADATRNPLASFVAHFTLGQVLAEADPARGIAILKGLAAKLEGTSALADLAQVYDELGKALTRQGLAEEGVVYAQRAYTASLNAKKGGV